LICSFHKRNLLLHSEISLPAFINKCQQKIKNNGFTQEKNGLKNLLIHISTSGGKVEKLSTKTRMWKSGKLP